MKTEQKTGRLVLLVLLLAGLFLVNEWGFSVILGIQHNLLPPLLRSLLLLLDGFIFLLILLVVRYWRQFEMTRFFLHNLALTGIILLMELGLRVAIAVVMPDLHATTLKKKIDPRAFYPAHLGAEWPLQDAEELGPFLYRDLMEYDPYLQWRSGEFHGTFTNIDHPGFRRTWNPRSVESADTVFVFGGSTIWGAGSRDDFTIPSLLSKKLAEAGRPVQVVNCGELAYISNQELTKLILMLKEGRRPDYVIFYDGFNDVTFAFRHKKAGSISNETLNGGGFLEERADWMFLGGREKIVRALGQVAAKSTLCRTFSLGFERINKLNQRKNDVFRKDIKAQEKLASEIRENYHEVMDQVNRLANAYGFKAIYFFQPILLLEDQLQDGEIPAYTYYHPRIKNIGSWPKKTYEFQKYRLVYQRMRTRRVDHFYNISDCLDDRTEPVYLDAVHLAENGNEMVAEKMMKILLKEGWLGNVAKKRER